MLLKGGKYPSRTFASTLRRVYHTGQTSQLSTLAIETSCDDTSVAVVNVEQPSLRDHGLYRTDIRYHETVTADSRSYKGIHPIVALESHQAMLAELVHSARSHLPRDNGLAKPTFVSVTRGPGMRSNLSVGLALAKGLAVAWNVPLVGVHHMQAHALTPRLCWTIQNDQHLQMLGRSSKSWSYADIEPKFPYLSVLVSGGHTMLMNSKTLLEHEILAGTEDIALGDCLDKAARAILSAERFSPPYGKALEDFAFPNGESDYDYTAPVNREEELQRRSTAWRWSVGPPLAVSKRGEKTSRRMAYSFVGLLSSIERFMQFQIAENGSPTTIARPSETVTLDERRCLAREVLRVTFEHLVSRILLYLSATNSPDIKTIVVSGGVASNKFLRHVFRQMLDARGFSHIETIFPPPSLCTDNALMIAWAGMEMFRAGYTSGLEIAPIRKWSMDPHADDGGILGVGGWRSRHEDD